MQELNLNTTGGSETELSYLNLNLNAACVGCQLTNPLRSCDRHPKASGELWVLHGPEGSAVVSLNKRRTPRIWGTEHLKDKLVSIYPACRASSQRALLVSLWHYVLMKALCIGCCGWRYGRVCLLDPRTREDMLTPLAAATAAAAACALPPPPPHTHPPTHPRNIPPPSSKRTKPHTTHTHPIAPSPPNAPPPLSPHTYTTPGSYAHTPCCCCCL